jgi:hypothetical protein
LLAVALAFAGIYYYLMNIHEFDFETNEYTIYSTIFIPVLFWSAISIFSLCFLSTLVMWLIFIYRFRSNKISVQLKFGEELSANAGWVPFTLTAKGVWRPMLGTIRGRLVFKGMKLSSPVVLDENVREKGRIFRKAISGRGETLLNDRGIYDVEEVQLFFYDMIRTIALPYTIHATKQFYTLPKELKELEIAAHPNATEEQTQRIPIPKRIEGEFINYKDFEAGDDVRRIVWKIYARNGELVVRIPEIKDPYASHLYFYASFFHPEAQQDAGVFETELLNRYKDRLRSIFEALKKNGFDVRIPHDQPTPKIAGVSERKNDLFHLSSANWQKDLAPNEFVQGGKAAFVCVSSMTPIEEISVLLNNIPDYVPVVGVKISEAIPSVFKFKVKSLFFKADENAVDQMKKPWMLSPLRAKLKKNETDMERLFRMRGNAFLLTSGSEE